MPTKKGGPAFPVPAVALPFCKKPSPNHLFMSAFTFCACWVSCLPFSLNLFWFSSPLTHFLPSLLRVSHPKSGYLRCVTHSPRYTRGERVRLSDVWNTFRKQFAGKEKAMHLDQLGFKRVVSNNVDPNHTSIGQTTPWTRFDRPVGTPYS